MLKVLSATVFAAAIAAVLTISFAPSEPVVAGPHDEATLKSCVARPWPYLNCVGTSAGNPKIRLVTTDHLAP